METQKVMYTHIDKKENYYKFCINIRNWKRIKKIIDNEFSNDYADFGEVRIWLNNDDTIDIEGHCCLNRRRKK